MKNLTKKILWVVLCVFIFISMFSISAVNKFASILGPDLVNGFTIQGNMATDPLNKDEVEKEIIDIKYIKNDGTIETRQIIVYRPSGVEGNIPIVFIPHYAVNEKTQDFASYIRNGWSVASTYNFKSEYNGLLSTDNLVFNNAALYTIRNLDGIDKQRIAMVGGSAGGYMTLMLNQLHMGTVASIANSPITNIYFNANVYFPAADEVNRNSGWFDFPIPVQGIISKSFQPINSIITDKNDPRWEALSPISMAKAFSNPVVINHNTGDILVPIDQVTKRYTYEDNDGSLPKGFNGKVGNNYPGILSYSLEELANPNEIFVNKYRFANNKVTGNMPYSDKLLTINVIDDGPLNAKGTHASPKTTGFYDTLPYLEDMIAKSLKETEVLVKEKVMLLLDRYLGNSIALIPHTNIDDTVYGSFAIYKKEVEDELSMWISNNSLIEMETMIQQIVLETSNNSYLIAWNEIKGKRFPAFPAMYSKTSSNYQ